VKISLVTVCFNGEKTIEDTIKSVISQTHEFVEYIIIDGGSRDGTAGIVNKYKAHVAQFVSEPDQGIYDAMNKGIHLATGDVIGFINADDFYADSGVVERVARTFEDSTIDACYGDLCYVKQDDTDSVVRYWKSSEFKSGFFLRGWCPPHPTFFARRSVYERFGGFDLDFRIAADMELMLRFLVAHDVPAAYLPHVLVKMRMGGTTNRSFENIVKQNREIWRAFKKHGLQPSLLSFLGGKMISRGRQFFSRPGEAVN